MRATHLLLAMIAFYRRFVSPLTPGCCRYEPSCSRYAELCIRHRGPWQGSWLALRRIARCNPFFSGGIDLPPLPSSVAVEPDYARIAKLFSPSTLAVASRVSERPPGP